MNERQIMQRAETNYKGERSNASFSGKVLGDLEIVREEFSEDETWDKVKFAAEIAGRLNVITRGKGLSFFFAPDHAGNLHVAFPPRQGNSECWVFGVKLCFRPVSGGWANGFYFHPHYFFDGVEGLPKEFGAKTGIGAPMWMVLEDVRILCDKLSFILPAAESKKTPS